MAKKKLEVEDSGYFDFEDDLDFDNEIDPGFNQQSKNKPRSPVGKVMKGFGSGLVDTAKSPQFIRGLVESSLPKTYGEITSAADEVVSGTYEIFDETVRELRPGLQRVTTKIDQLIPENSKILKKISEKLMDLTGAQKGIDYSSAENQEDQAVTTALSAIFDQTTENEHARDTKQLLRDRIQMKQANTSANLLREISASVSTSAQYTTKIEDKFYRKSLELQVRSYMSQQDLAHAIKTYQETTKAQLEAIVKNTSLPEYAKITNAERLKDMIKTNVSSSLFGSGSFVRQGMDRLKSSARDFVSGIGRAVDSADMGLDMAVMSKDQMEAMNESMASMGIEGFSKEEIAGAAAAGFAADYMRDLVSTHLKKHTDKMPKLNEALAKGARFAMNPGTELEKLRSSDQWQDRLNKEGVVGTTAKALDYVFSHFSDDENNRKFSAGTKLEELNQPSKGFDNKAHISLVDVIPGHLSAIHRAIEMLRTGKDFKPMVYDFERREFVNNKELGQRIFGKLETEAKLGSHNYYADNLRQDFDTEKTLSETESKELHRFFVRIAQIPNFEATPEAVRETRAYEDLSPKVRELADLRLSEIKHSETPEKAMYDFDSKVKAVRKTIPSMNDSIRKYIDAGYGSHLEKYGLVKKDDEGDYKVDETEYSRFLENNGMVRSDVNVKEALRKMSPTDVLSKVKDRFSGKNESDEDKAQSLVDHYFKNKPLPKDRSSKKWNPKESYNGIKKTGLFDWLYQPGKGDDQEHSGPMAQDVRHNLGEEAAPGGKSIDLQSMNGATMAAVQHLGDRVEAVENNTKEDPVVEQLRLIKKDTLSISELLSSGKGAGGVGRKTPEDYKEFITELLNTMMSLGEKTAGDVMSAGKTTFEFGRDQVVTPAYEAAMRFYKEKKGPALKAMNKLIEKASDFGLSVMDFQQKLVKDILPEQLSKLKKSASKAYHAVTSTVSKWFNEAKDLYLPNGTKPIIQAVKLRMGFYRDASTGKVIETMDELLACKNDVVDAAGNVVLSLEDKAKGLYDTYGEEVRTTLSNLGSAALGLAISIKDRAVDNFRKLMKHAPGALQGFKDKATGFIESGTGMIGNSRVLDSSLQVQSDIRDILLGYKKEVQKRLRKEGWKPAGLTKVIHSVKGETQPEDLPQTEKGGSSGEASGETESSGSLSKELQEKMIARFPSLAHLSPTKLRERFNKMSPEQQKKLTDLKDQAKLKYESVRDSVFSKLDKLKKPKSVQETAKKEEPFEAFDDDAEPERKLDAWKRGQTEGEKKAQSMTDKYFKQKPELMQKGPAATPATEAPTITKPSLRSKLGGLGGKIRGKLVKAGGILGAMGALGGLFGTNDPKPETPMDDPEHTREHAEGKENGPVKTKKKRIRKPTGNDQDGDGLRDNGIEDQAEKLAALTESRKKKAAEADLSIRYKNEMSMSSLLGSMSSVIGMVTSGVSGLFSVAGGLLSKIPGIGKLLGGAAGAGVKGMKAAGGLLSKGLPAAATVAGKGLGLYAKGIWTAAKIAVPLVATSLWSVGSAVVGGLASVLASPVVLGAAAIAATGYGIWKLYKYATRDNFNEFEDIRLRQYGFNYNTEVKKYNHFVYGLEAYLQDGKVGYQSGQAYINDKIAKPEEMLELFGIDKEDKDAVKNFTTWFGQRFKPVFLTHLTALFAQDRKMKLDDIEKLPHPKNRDYLKAAQFSEGPYDQTTSPLKELPVLSAERKPITDMTTALIKKLEDDAVKKIQDKARGKVTPHSMQPKAILPPTDSKEELEKAERAADKREAERLKQSQQNNDASKNPNQPTGESETKPVDFSKMIENGTSQSSSTSINDMPKIPSNLPVAPGGILQGEGGMDFITMGKKVNLQGLVPGVYKNFLGMSEEYGKITGNRIQVNEGKRSYEQQEMLYKSSPKGKAAKPGHSLHEFGLALDIQSADADKLDKLGLMRKYGFTRPVGGEPWHIEPAGIQRNLTLAKTDQSTRDIMIAASPLHGGGGYGTLPDSTMGKRNNALAMELLGVDSRPVTPKPDAADKAASMATNIPSATEKVMGDKPAANSPKFQGPQAVKSTAGEDQKTSENRSVSTTVPSPKMVDTKLNAKAANDASTPEGDQGAAWNADVKSRAQSLDELKSLVAAGARKVGVEPTTAQTFVAVESDFNPNARAGTSSASGLYQFLGGTWSEQLSRNGAKHGIDRGTSPTDPKAAAVLGPEYIKQNALALQSVRPNPNVVDLYLAHLLGAAGAKKFLSADPSQEAAVLFPQQASANQAIFYGGNARPKTIAQIYNDLGTKLKTKAAKYGINPEIASMSKASPPQAQGTGIGESKPVDTNQPKLPSPSKQAAMTTPQNVVANSSYQTTKNSGLYVPQQTPPSEVRRQESGQAPTAVNLTTIEGYLEKSVSLQTDSLSVLKDILKNVEIEKVAEVLATCIGTAVKANDAKKESPVEKEKSKSGRFERTSASSLDLKRKAG